MIKLRLKKWLSLFVLLCSWGAPCGAQAPSLEKDLGRTVADHLGGDGATYSIRSAILNQERRIHIATPESFASTGESRRYPVIIVFDGEASFGRTVAAARYLADAGQVPEALVVAVENISSDPRDRVRDLTPPGLSVSGSSTNEGGDRFLDFLEKELLPALAQQFRAGPPNVLIGHSSGGVLVTYAAATRSGRFPFIVAIDTPMETQQGWLAARLTESTRKPSAGPLRYASLEARFGWGNKSWNALLSAAPATWKLYREKLAHETHNSMAFLATYLGLREVFAEYSMLAAPGAPASPEFAPTSAAIEYYRRLNQTLATSLVPPRALLVRVTEDFIMEGNAPMGQNALDLLVAGYGDTPLSRDLRAKVLEAAKLPPLAATVEDLLSAPRPEAARIGAYLGEWEGSTLTIFSGSERSERHRLRLEIKDGQVTGAWYSWPAPDVEFVSTLQYLKVTDDGLHFGFMNGMRPRGMIVYEGVLRDGKLEGEMHMRGIRFTPPSGRTPPKTTFSLSPTKPAAVSR